MSAHSALVRADHGGLEPRRFASADDARAASAASGREWSEPAVLVAAHPQGGFTHARRLLGTARIYAGNWPTRRAASRALPAE